MDIKYYAGIGSRQTPPDMITMMTSIAGGLERLGFTLRSGGAAGADSAFAAGCKRKEIFRPVDATPQALCLAATVHPAWDCCNDYARRLHARNCQIVLGRDLLTPVRFVVCWTPNASGSGGTGQAIRLARSKGIAVYDLADPACRFLEYLDRALQRA